MSVLQDSGERRQFASGAVRDINHGKGRCDLLPLDMVAFAVTNGAGADPVFQNLYQFMRTLDPFCLTLTIKAFNEKRGWDRATAMLEVSRQYEDGAVKYGERNWEKGIPVHCYIDSAVRHYLKWLRGDKDEPHDRAVVWNLLGAMWTMQHRPELNDLPNRRKEASPYEMRNRG